MSLRGKPLDRRSFLTKSAAAAGALALGGCDGIPAPRLDGIFAASESLTLRAQRLLLSRSDLAKEYSEADISPQFRANGTTEPDTRDYQALAEANFSEWRLEVIGLVEQPSRFSRGAPTAPLQSTDYPARLCGRLELHRQVAGSTAQCDLGAGQAQA